VPDLFAPLSLEQRDFRAAVRDFAAARGGSDRVRRTMATEEGFDRAVWRQMSDQLGLQALVVPERYGGAGFGPLEAAIVFEELGRTLLGSPLLAGSFAASVLLAVDDEAARSELLPEIAGGRTIVTLALGDAEGRWGEDVIGVEACERGAGHALTGASGFVLDGAVADTMLVVARAAEGPSLFAVDAGAEGLQRERMQTLDETRRLARLSFAETPGRRIGAAGTTWPAVAQAVDLMLTNLAAEHVGATETLLEMSVDYARTRHQFGRPIGSFQAIKHKCADLLVALDSSRSAAGYAAWVAAEEPENLPAAAALAAAYCAETFLAAAKTTIQIHGGIGFTWEHDAHLYLRRAKSSQLLFGSPSHHLDVLARAIGL
jgi:alkylation response protein AidB-like acyl-CoA dehydrogenase